MFRSAKPRTGVLFVCANNICRSPLAEGVFRHRATRARLAATLTIDSAGTHDAHAGEPPDARAVMVASRRGYTIRRRRARRIEREDFTRFQWILAMDERNLAALQAQVPPDFAGHLRLLLDFVPEFGTREVDDPYYGPLSGFERVVDLCEAASDALIATLAAQPEP
jgi:protein-tyrosine phosphatase